MVTELKEGNPSAASFFKFQAFTTAVVQDERIRTRMKAAIAGNIKRGEGYREFAEVIESEFERAGLTRLASHQIENIYETNVSLAYAGGQMQKIIESADMFPFWKYSAILDGKTRPKHAALHGKIFRNGDFTFFPPIDYRCRCTAILLTARQAGRYPKTDMPAADEKRKLYNNLESKTFAGNKQQKFMEWIAVRYNDMDRYSRSMVDQAFEVMKKEIRELEYESAKAFFREDYIQKAEQKFLSDNRLQQAAEAASLTQAEAFRIFTYTDSTNQLSADLTRLFYGRKPKIWDKSKLLEFQKDIVKAVRKLPKVSATVYRGLEELSEKFMKELPVTGSEIQWNGFLSATKLPGEASGAKILLKMQVKTARDMEGVSIHPGNKEALLLPGTRLKVIQVKILKNQVIITMEEI